MWSEAPDVKVPEETPQPPKKPMPGLGDPPAASEPTDKKKKYYIENFGMYWRKGDGTDQTRIGFPPDIDGQNFAAYHSGNEYKLEQQISKLGWDGWMKIPNIATGATQFEHIYAKMADAISAARIHLQDKNLLTPEKNALFTVAESVGTSIYNLRSEDNEKFRSGYKVTKPVERVVRECEIADALRKTPEFQSLHLTPEETKEVIKTKGSGIISKPKTRSATEWQVLDKKATAELWKAKIPNIEEVIDRVCDAWKLGPKAAPHYSQIYAMGEGNRKIRNAGFVAVPNSCIIM